MRIDPLRYAVLLPTLWAAHSVADHVVQTDHQAANKAADLRAMTGHVGSYQATQLGALLVVSRLTGVGLSWRGVLAGSVFSAVTHAVLDRRWPVREILRRTGSPGFADTATPINGMYQADQALHHGCLLISALLMARPAR